METVTCQVCRATATVGWSGGERRIIPNRDEMKDRCKHWPPAKQGGFMGALITGCEHLEQSVMMTAAFARRAPRPIS